MNIIINDASDVKHFIWQWLSLDEHAIVFHVINVGDGMPHVGGGLIRGVDDLYNSDIMYDIGSESLDEYELEVFNVETYCIGKGESEQAGDGDCEIIAQMIADYPISFENFLDEYAESLCNLYDLTVANPACGL